MLIFFDSYCIYSMAYCCLNIHNNRTHVCIQDVFRGNTMFLVPGLAIPSTNRPIRVKKKLRGYPKLKADGKYDSDSDGENESMFYL